MTKVQVLALVVAFIIGNVSGYVVSNYDVSNMQVKTAQRDTLLDSQVLTEQRPSSQYTVHENDSMNNVVPFVSENTDGIASDELVTLVSEAIRKELEPLLDSLQQNKSLTVVESSLPIISTEVVQALEIAETTVEAAKITGVWDRQSAQNFVLASHKLPPKEWEKAVGKLFVAINTGELRLEDGLLDPITIMPND